MSTFVITSDFSILCAGCNHDGKLGLGDYEDRKEMTKMESNQRFVAISCGDYHTIGLDDQGNLYSCGDNSYGQLGLGDNTKRNGKN